MFCSNCGKPLPEGATFCPSCGAIVPRALSAAAPPVASAGATATMADPPPLAGSPIPPAPPTMVAAAAPVLYAGFWRRFWAFVIDSLILTIVMMPFGVGLWGTIVALSRSGMDNMDAIYRIIAASMMTWMLRGIVTWAYRALFESSAWQGTPGKKLLGLAVTDLEGRRITFLRATGRAFGKVLSSALLGIGYIMVAFTEKKQGLHDLLAGTVVRR